MLNALKRLYDILRIEDLIFLGLSLAILLAMGIVFILHFSILFLKYLFGRKTSL